ncbi:HEAT repeat-containing protein 2 [Rhizophlyctis rosea]|uniref:HEAT repeat-containing protein 2 n=1 Tax=Rhizophlyctis rosea TaxID=64517 RepID=A0AAD5SIA5_9FUNG|nr:HEAT repeat-containing protein 2 [Rhizophlyctis rosea]
MMGDNASTTSMTQDSGGEISKSLSPQLLEKVETTLQTLQRDMNILTEQTTDRIAKRRALERIQRETVDRKDLGEARSLVLTAIFGSLMKPVLRCISDPVEKCREVSVGLISRFTDEADQIGQFLPYVIPAAEGRLAQLEIVEPAEEIRLQLVKLLAKISRKGGSDIASYSEIFVRILSKTLVDPFPDVRKKSCEMVEILCVAIPRALSYHGAAISKALIPSLQHRHSSVRIAAIQAVRAAILVHASGLDDLAEPLRALTLDKMPSVREALYTTAAEWLLKMIDRYSLGYKVLPLLLSAQTDEVAKYQELGRKLMDDVGALYEQEWESRVKDELDYVQEARIMAGRARVGARHAARDHTQKIVGSSVEAMANWNADVRAKSAQVLAVFITYAEAEITGYTNAILPALYRILSGDDAHVMQQATRVAEFTGTYVEPDIYLQLIAPQIRTGGGGSTQFRIGCLRVLAGLVRGASVANRIDRHVEALADLLNERELIENENVLLLNEVSGVTRGLVEGLGSTRRDAGLWVEGYKLFLILVKLAAVPGNDQIPGYANLRNNTTVALSALAAGYGLSTVQDLYALHFDAVLNLLQQSHTSWTQHSPEKRMLETTLVESGRLVGQRLDGVVPIFSNLVGAEREPELKHWTLNIMLRLLANSDASLNSAGHFSQFSKPVLETIVIPNAVWKAGRKQAVVRDITMRVLLALLQNGEYGGKSVGLLDVAAVESVLSQDLLPIIVSCMDDDNVEERRTTLGITDILLRSEVRFNGPAIKLLYPELLKRMDDAHDDIRIQTANIWRSFFIVISKWFSNVQSLRDQAPGIVSVLVDEQGQVVGENGSLVEIALDDVHWHAIVKGLTVHMDDTNSQIQDTVREALEKAIAVSPISILREELLAVRNRHRSPMHIDKILQKVA